MDHEFSPDRVADTLQSLCRHWEEKRKAAASSSDVASTFHYPLTIALSREAGTQGTAVAQEVGKRLGWSVYDQELVERIAQDMGLHARLLKSVDERRGSWLLETCEALTSAPYVSESAYVHRLVKTVLALGSHGESVIVGRGAVFILPAEMVLRVRLVAPVKDRIATMREQMGLSQDKAARQVEAVDRERNTFVRHHFSKDPADPRNYDLILDSARFGVVGCAELMIAALDRLRAHVASAARQARLAEAFLPIKGA